MSDMVQEYRRQLAILQAKEKAATQEIRSIEEQLGKVVAYRTKLIGAIEWTDAMLKDASATPMEKGAEGELKKEKLLSE